MVSLNSTHPEEDVNNEAIVTWDTRHCMETGYGTPKQQDLRSSDCTIKMFFPSSANGSMWPLHFIYRTRRTTEFAGVDPRSHLSYLYEL